MPPTTQKLLKQQDTAKAGAKTVPVLTARAKYNVLKPKGRKATCMRL